MGKSRRRRLLFAGSLLLAACTTQPDLLPPETAEGRACVAACDAVRGRCLASARAEADTAASMCDNSAQVDSCVSRAVDDRTVRACEAKRSTGACPGTVAETAPCDEERTLCALRCGARLAEP